ncbi:MAG: type 1 glutamine amidotransferase [Actinomycetes bacterium]
MAKAVIVQHVAHEGPGWLAEVLDDAGMSVDIRAMYDGAALPRVDEVGALVVLGGPMGAYDDEQVPWLGEVKQLMVGAVEHHIPTLGVCLGAQLLAVACGGRVTKGAAGPELGLGDVRLTGDARDDALLGALERDVQTVQWHWDCIELLPQGAVPLASSTAYENQAFRLGEQAWGFQFHPEVTLPLVAQWAQDDASGVREAGLDPTHVVGAVADAERALLETWTPVLDRFARLTRDR